MGDILFFGFETIAAAVPSAVILAIRRLTQNGKETARGGSKIIPATIFAFYIIGVFHFTGLVTVYELLREPAAFRPESINLLPFSNDIDPNAYLLNVFMLIPLGILAPYLCEKARSLPAVLLLGAGFSLFIELTQLLNERRTDIDDLILNTLGAAIGYALYKMLDRLTDKKLRRNVLTIPGMCIVTLALFAGRFLLYNEMGLAHRVYGF